MIKGQYFLIEFRKIQQLRSRFFIRKRAVCEIWPSFSAANFDLLTKIGEQIKAIGLTLVLAIVGTTIIAYIVKALIGLRPSEEVETAGLDISEHGEEGYHGSESAT